MNRTSNRILLIVAAFALFLVPVAAIAAAGFDDVADDSVFVADIQWMKDAGVTKGCNPPANTKFCPENNVTREQMSAFMHRLAVNKVVDAATAVEADNADTLDGKDSTEFLGKTEKAADSDKLDGMDSAAFKGLLASDAIDWDNDVTDPGGVFTKVLSVTGFDVPADGGAIAVTGAVQFLENSGSQVGFLWIEIDGTGACDSPASTAVFPAGTIMFETFTAPWPTGVTTGAMPVAAGSHRIDLCTFGLTGGVSTDINGRLLVQWAPSASAAGVLGSDGGTPTDKLMEYGKQLMDRLDG